MYLDEERLSFIWIGVGDGWWIMVGDVIDTESRETLEPDSDVLKDLCISELWMIRDGETHGDSICANPTGILLGWMLGEVLLW